MIVESKDTHFHRIRNAHPKVTTTNPNATPPSYLYDRLAGPVALAEPRNWRYKLDHEVWTNTKPQLVLNAPTPAELNGTLWLHADTKVGDGLDVGTGAHGEQLANHHEHSYGPEGHWCHVAVKVKAIKSPFFLFQTLPDPPWELESPLARVDAARGETEVLVATDGGLGAVNDEGLLELMTDRVGPALAASLADPSLVWTNVAEPFAEQGAGRAFPLAVALGDDGSQLAESVTSNGELLLGSLDRAEPIPPRTGSPHATGYAAVLSRVERGVFVVGGDDPDTGEPTGEIWQNRLSSAEWVKLPASLRPERVLAATYSFATGELVVLDETAGGRARLWAVRIRDASTRLFAEVERHPSWDRHALAIDRDGSVLVASSSSSEDRHAIARLDLRAAPAKLSGREEGPGVLAVAPIVDPYGYRLIAQAAGGWPDEVIVAEHRARLRSHSEVTGEVTVLDTALKSKQSELLLGPHALLFGVAQADTVRVKHDASIRGDLFYNELFGKGSAADQLIAPLALPVAIALPALPSFVVGGPPIVVNHHQQLALDPGSYGKVAVKAGSANKPTVLALTGGIYELASLGVGSHARVECLARCEIRVAVEVEVGSHGYLGPAEWSDLRDGQVVVFVGGVSCPKPEVELGPHARVVARIFVAGGPITLKNEVDAVGTFVASEVTVGPHATVRKGERGLVSLRRDVLATSPAPLGALAAQL